MANVEFSDAFLLVMLRKAARRVNRKLDLIGTDCEISVDNSGNISPQDEALEDIVVMQAECLISQTELQKEMRDGTAGIFVRDGEQSVDNRLRASIRERFMNGEHSPCQQVKEAIMLWRLDNGGGYGVY